jgi:excisionase family DNA binding protein
MDSINVSEAAARLGVNHKVIRRLIAQGHVSAALRMGRHGKEWRIDPASLDSYQSRSLEDIPVEPTPARRAEAPASGVLDELRQDKAFLQEQVRRLTKALSRRGLLPEAEPLDEPGTSEGKRTTLPALTEPLQNALRLVDPGSVVALEFAATREIWGRPVLWRTVARGRTDVAALLDAILAPGAEWDPPAAPTCFVFVRDASGGTLWGTACGPRWFGPAFEQALRRARVERL